MQAPAAVKRLAFCALLAAGLLPTLAAGVQPHRFPGTVPGVMLGAGAPWNTLTPGEQEVLRKYRRDWSGYPPEKQDRLRDGAQRYLSLPPEKRDEVRRKQEQYRELPPEERKRLREQYRRQQR
jgi:hypothetical protein